MLTMVEHTVSHEGIHRVIVALFDGPEGGDGGIAMADRYFWVLWGTMDVKAGAEQTVEPDDQAGVSYYHRASPDTTALGARPHFLSWKTGMEYVYRCSPAEWDLQVAMRRSFGPNGARMWGGPNGDQLAKSEPAGEPDDTDQPDLVDMDPQSETTNWPPDVWPPDTEFKSSGVTYDIDVPGYSDTTGDTYRIRANWYEWAECQGHRASDDLATDCAASVTRAENQWVVDHGLDGDGDNSAGPGHLASTDWDLDG